MGSLTKRRSDLPADGEITGTLLTDEKDIDAFTAAYREANKDAP